MSLKRVTNLLDKAFMYLSRTFTHMTATIQIGKKTKSCTAIGLFEHLNF